MLSLIQKISDEGYINLIRFSFNSHVNRRINVQDTQALITWNKFKKFKYFTIWSSDFAWNQQYTEQTNCIRSLAVDAVYDNTIIALPAFNRK